MNIFSAGYLYSYSFEGNFLGRSAMGFFDDMTVEDSLIYASNTPFGRNDKYRMIILSNDLDTVGGILNYALFDTGGMSIMLSSPFRQSFYKFSGDIYFKGYQDNDTVWRLDGTEYQTHAIIDMGKYKYPECKSVEEWRTFADNFTQKKGDYYRVNTVLEDNYFIYLSIEPYYNPEMGSPCLLYDKHQNTGFTAKISSDNDGIADDMGGGPAFWPRIITDNYYVSVTNAPVFVEKSRSLPAVSSQFVEFMRNIDEESNPIVTIATRKK